MLCAHQKTIICGQSVFSKWKTLIILRLERIFPKCYDSPGLTIYGQENSPAQPGEVTDDGSIMPTQESQKRSSHSPLSSFDLKNSNTHTLGAWGRTILIWLLINLRGILFEYILLVYHFAYCWIPFCTEI